MFIIFFILEFALIFFLSKEVSKALSHMLLKYTRSNTITIHTLSIIFLPGVIVHELAHWLMASMLFVRTGRIEFMPKVHDDKIKLGSVAVAKTDPIRRFFIGVAPILFGLLVIFSLYILFFPKDMITFSWKLAIFLYLLFEIGNTMYSSSKDMEGAIGFFAIFAVLVIIYFLFGLHLPAPIIQGITSEKVQGIFAKLDIFLGILAGLNLAVVGFLRLFLK